MQVTSELLAKYVGGQMEIQNQGEGYVYRGEVRTAIVDIDELQVKFVWLARGVGYPPVRWVKADQPDYAASLEIYHTSDIGDGRLCFSSAIVGEQVVLFPPDGSKLDPAKVEGLQLG
jgi:hypothetical protein